MQNFTHIKQNSNMQRRQKGFTLIELMITVACIAIIVAIALPTYQQIIIKGKRAEGRAALMGLLQQQERSMTQTGSYTVFAAGATSTAFKAWSGESVQSSAYLLKAEPCPASSNTSMDIKTCVLLSAVPQFKDLDAGTITLKSIGPAKSCTGSQKDKPEVCWP